MVKKLWAAIWTIFAVRVGVVAYCIF